MHIIPDVLVQANYYRVFVLTLVVATVLGDSATHRIPLMVVSAVAIELCLQLVAVVMPAAKNKTR